jgi:uncharacterized OB-fold protein
MNAPTVPAPTEITQPYWDATREQRLLLQWCPACDHGIYYPRIACPDCGSRELEWRVSAGRGEVYAASTHFGADEPYVVALITLDEGVRVLSNVVNTDPDAVKVGQRVQVAWLPLEDGRALPQFEPEQGK